jgi:hypothetical protein
MKANGSELELRKSWSCQASRQGLRHGLKLLSDKQGRLGTVRQPASGRDMELHDSSSVRDESHTKFRREFCCTCSVANAHRHAHRLGSLLDCGANGGVGGGDCQPAFFTPDSDGTHRKVHLQGLNERQTNDAPVANVGAVITTNKGPAIAIFNQHAHQGTGKTVHSSGQIEWHGHDANGKSVRIKNSLQRIRTACGHILAAISSSD